MKKQKECKHLTFYIDNRCEAGRAHIFDLSSVSVVTADRNRINKSGCTPMTVAAGLTLIDSESFKLNKSVKISGFSGLSPPVDCLQKC